MNYDQDREINLNRQSLNKYVISTLRDDNILIVLLVHSGQLLLCGIMYTYMFKK